MTKTVGIVMGSDSDLPTMRQTVAVLQEFGIPFDINVISAHRTPEAARRFAAEAQSNGIGVIVAAAGGAAHLAGVLAAHTTLPVVGVPIQSAALNGIDSLYSTVQMPSGVPVGTMAIGDAGAKNAGLFAAQILAVGDSALSKKMEAYKANMAAQVEAKNKKVKSEFS